MNEESLLRYYENKLSFTKLVYKKMPLWKKFLQNVPLFILMLLVAGTSLVSGIDHDQSGPIWSTLLQYGVALCIGWTMIRLALYLHARHTAWQVKRSKKLKHIYVNRSKVDWEKFRKWQSQEMAKTLNRWGYSSREELESLHHRMGEWMKRERFWIVSYAALGAAIGLPLWSAFLASLFDKDVTTFNERFLVMLLLSLLVIVGCVGIRMTNEIYNTSFSKHSRISDVRDLLETVIIGYKDLRKELKRR